MFVVFEKNGAIFLVSLCPIAKSSTTKSRFARLDNIDIICQAISGFRLQALRGTIKNTFTQYTYK